MYQEGPSQREMPKVQIRPSGYTVSAGEVTPFRVTAEVPLSIVATYDRCLPAPPIAGPGSGLVRGRGSGPFYSRDKDADIVSHTTAATVHVKDALMRALAPEVPPEAWHIVHTRVLRDDYSREPTSILVASEYYGSEGKPKDRVYTEYSDDDDYPCMWIKATEEYTEDGKVVFHMGRWRQGSEKGDLTAWDHDEDDYVHVGQQPHRPSRRMSVP
jgi:hypothetical protein